MAITFNKSDQIITITIPDTEITIQELVYAIRNYEDSQTAMDIFKIADASGKEPLGSGLLVGITLKLLDWKLQFEDRPGPDWILCDIQAGNLLAISGSDEVFINPVEPSAFVTVTKPLAVSAALISAASLPTDVADAVWDEPIADHQQTGSTGEALASISISGSSPSAIADAVWDELLTDHQISGSAGYTLDKMQVVLGLLQSNFKMFNQTYDNNNNMIEANIRIYSTPTDADADINHIKQYTITAAYNIDGNLTDYVSIES